MSARALLVSAACILVVACGGRSENAARPAAADSPEPAAETHTGTDANTVRIEEGMLRDLRITVDEVESRPGGEHITLLGELAVDERAYAEVGAPVQARVTRLLVNAGETVRRGQTLAELTSPELGQARAEYLSAEARVKLADAALDRKKGLAAEKIVPLREVQEAESLAAEARAALRTVRAAIGAFGVEPPSSDSAAASSLFVLRSPVGGSVIERRAVVGQMLDPVTPAFRVGDLSTLWLTVHAFERDAVRIRSGATARLVFPAMPGRDFEGRVSMVGQHVESESRTVPVRIDVRNTIRTLRPGMSATALLPVGVPGDPILSVPVAAVQRVRNEWCVFLPKGEGAFEIRRIGRGRDLAGEVEVLSGLRAGEQIVVDGAFLLKAQAERGQAGHDAH
ncbi:MAG TPA: efflux RND transporter periplasmic adaptor subunit [Vicinamibacterales bacterium]|nr:efflux RND transporter periplasmic adaptor subunit [Vicinamibacterales bacterium]